MHHKNSSGASFIFSARYIYGPAPLYRTITLIGPLMLLPVLAFASFFPHSLPFVYCPEDGRSKVLLQIGIYIPVYMAS
jgi:hypothetical protein